MTDPMREYIKGLWAKVYEQATPDSIGRAWLNSLAILLGIIFLTSFMFGLLAGASAALDGEAIAGTLVEVQALEGELWTDMLRDGSAVTRGVYGLLHWVTALALWLAMVGIQVGYALPIAGHLVKYVGDLLIYGLVFVWILQYVRAVELAYHKIGGDRVIDG